MRAPVTPVARRPLFVDHCAELLAPLGAVRVKRMFGGWGLYVDDIFLALIA
jgi:DNA transformation protein and related proteins